MALLMSCVTTITKEETSSGYSELRPFAATSLGRVIVGQADTMLPSLLQSIRDAEKASSQSAGGDNQLVVFYLLQALREVGLLAKLLTKSPRLLSPISDEAPPTTHIEKVDVLLSSRRMWRPQLVFEH